MSLFASLTPLQTARHFDQYFTRLKNNRPTRPLQIRVFSRILGLDYTFPPDSTNQPYHIASIGKVFTAVLVQRLAQKGVLSTKDFVHKFFSASELDRLFVFQSVDYAQQVTVEHLLGHTSGIADYFEGHTTSGESLIETVFNAPQTHWTPQDLIAFTRAHQTAAGVPGRVFNYSDTGYILLGLIVEKVTRKSFAQNLSDEIFQPLEMRDSYLMFYSDPLNTPKKDIEKIWFNQTEISRFESLSCDWSGGGIITTTSDLLKFSLALRSGRLLPGSALEAMDVCSHRFRPGIYYGLGMMEIRFKEFFFLLGRLPKVKGHIGILATHMFYDPTKEAHILVNFGDNTRMIESFQALIQIESTLQRMHAAEPNSP